MMSSRWISLLRAVFAAGGLRVLLGVVCCSSFGPAFAQDSGASAAAGQAALGKAETIHSHVLVAAIHPATNSVTLRSPRGTLADVDVNPALADVSKLRVGDKLNVAYQQALLIHLDKLATRGVRERVETTAAIPASAGYASSAHRVVVTATVVAIDRKKGLVTLRGPKHREVLQASEEIPLNEVKVGDSVRAEFVSAVAVELVREKGRPG